MYSGLVKIDLTGVVVAHAAQPADARFFSKRFLRNSRKRNGAQQKKQQQTLLQDENTAKHVALKFSHGKSLIIIETQASPKFPINTKAPLGTIVPVEAEKRFPGEPLALEFPPLNGLQICEDL
jgi:hypothetical protein